MNEEQFVMSLIAAEERQAQQEPEDEGSKLFFIERENFTIDRPFTPVFEDEEGEIRQLPLSDSGVLDSLVVIGDSSNYRMTLEVDEFNVVDDKTFSELQSISIELSHVGAFTNDGKSIISVSSYPFQEHLNMELEPTGEEVDFTLVRLEVITGEGDVDVTPGGVSPEVSNLLDI